MLLLLGCPVLCSMCCFWIHLRSEWCSRRDFVLLSHSVQQGCETWLWLFCLHVSFPEPVSSGGNSGLSCNRTATFNTKDRLLVFWTELSVAVLSKEAFLPISGCDGKCNSSEADADKACWCKTWKAGEWSEALGCVSSGAWAAPIPLLPCVLVAQNAAALYSTALEEVISFVNFCLFSNLMHCQGAEVPTYLLVSFCENPVKGTENLLLFLFLINVF